MNTTTSSNLRRGVLNGRAKLTADDVRLIRKLYANRQHGTATYRLLAQRFNITVNSVTNVLKRRTYADVT